MVDFNIKHNYMTQVTNLIFKDKKKLMRLNHSSNWNKYGMIQSQHEYSKKNINNGYLM